MAYNPNNSNGQKSAANSAPVVLANDVTSPFSIAEATTGGASVKYVTALGGQNVTQVKIGQGKITGWYIYNNNGSARKVSFYDVSSAPTLPTAATFAIIIPGLSAANCPFPAGINFTNGIYFATTASIDDITATPVAVNDLIINIFYK